MACLITADLAGKTLILPPAALPDLTKLGPARIETRWRPRSVPDGYFPTVEGYYVVYNHENLSLFFGPVETEPEAITIQRDLEATRQTLISRNSALSTSTVGRINIDFGGEPPTIQTGTPPEGLKPVRVLSGDSTLELGKEQNESDSTAGSTTEETTASDYGIGTSETSDQAPDDESTEGTGSGGGGSAEAEASGEQSDPGGEGSESGNQQGQDGILNVISPGLPNTATQPGTEGDTSDAELSGASDNPTGSSGASEDEGQSLDPGDRAGQPGQPGDDPSAVQGTPSGQEQAESGGNPAAGGADRTAESSESSSSQSGQEGEGQPGSSSGSPGSPPASPGQQPPESPAPPTPPSIPSLKDLLKGSAPSAPSASAGEGQANEQASSQSGQEPGEPPLETGSPAGSEGAQDAGATAEEQNPSDQTTFTQTSENSTEATHPSSQEGSKQSEAEPSASSESEEDAEEPEKATETPPVPEEKAPSPTEVEKETLNPIAPSLSPSTIHINQLLKGRLGDSLPPIPPKTADTPE